MKIKKEIIVLAVIIVALTLYLVFHKSDRTQYQLPVLPKVASKDITQLEIQQSAKTITLNKKDNKWHIAPKDYIADTGVIDQMLDVIDDLALTALASESESYNRYDLVDDKKIIVKARTGQILAREFEIGKPVPTYQHTFIHLMGDPNIYHADGNFRNTFDKTVEILRDKTVLSLEKSQVQNLQITKRDTVRKFDMKSVVVEPEATLSVDEKEPPKTRMEWQTTNGEKADQTMIDGLLGLLVRLKCDTYHENENKNDFNDPIYTIELKGSLNATLSIFDELNEDADKYAAISSQNDYPFFLAEYQGKNIIEKIDALLKHDDKK